MSRKTVDGQMLQRKRETAALESVRIAENVSTMTDTPNQIATEMD